MKPNIAMRRRKKTYLVRWAASVILESTVKAASGEEAVKMARNNDCSFRAAELKQCEVIDAELISVLIE